jgi:hypothetical protein
MSKPRIISPSTRPGPTDQRRKQLYQPPRLEEYGSIKDLTQSNSNRTPGDPFGGSFVV